MSESTPKKKLLLLSPLPPPAGGIATWTHHLLGSRLAEEFNIRLINTQAGAEAKQESSLSLRKGTQNLSIFLRLFWNLLFFRPHLVHINSSAGLFGSIRDSAYVLLARLFFCRVCIQFHNSRLPQLFNRKLGSFFGSILIKRSHLVLALNNPVLNFLQERSIDHGRKIANFTTRTEEVIREDRGGQVRFLYVGWLMRNKGILEALESLKAIPEASLVLLGRYVDSVEEKSRPLIESAVQELGLEERVSIPGEVPLDQVARYFADADVFLLPSYSEGFPLSLLEAMMAGLPIIATTVGAIPEVVTHGESGLLIPPRDQPALQKAMATLVTEADTRRALGKMARQRAMESYEVERVLNGLADLYRQVLEKGRLGKPSSAGDQA